MLVQANVSVSEFADYRQIVADRPPGISKSYRLVGIIDLISTW